LAIQPEIIAIDLDIVHPNHAVAAAGLIDEFLGVTPLVRVGSPPKCVRIYRNGDGVRSQKLHPVEIFAGTGQIVAFGWHPEAGRPYHWPGGSPLNLAADSTQIPPVTRAQLSHFIKDLFRLVPRRPLPARKEQPVDCRWRPMAVSERLRMLTMRYGSWRYAARIVLSEATVGCRNETGWAVVASAAGRGIPESVVLQLFEKYFCGWEGFSETQLMSAIERTRRVRQSPSMRFDARADTVDARLGRQSELDRNNSPVLGARA
jgi:hypothetical protein